jgi:hypothetical protein
MPTKTKKTNKNIKSSVKSAVIVNDNIHTYDLAKLDKCIGNNEFLKVKVPYNTIKFNENHNIISEYKLGNNCKNLMNHIIVFIRTSSQLINITEHNILLALDNIITPLTPYYKKILDDAMTLGNNLIEVNLIKYSDLIKCVVYSEDSNTIVKKSKIPEAGKGLFTTRSFEVEEPILLVYDSIYTDFAITPKGMYINHSFTPNCNVIFKPNILEHAYLYAIKPLYAGEEILIDYKADGKFGYGLGNFKIN